MNRSEIERKFPPKGKESGHPGHGSIHECGLCYEASEKRQAAERAEWERFTSETKVPKDRDRALYWIEKYPEWKARQ